MLVAQLTDCHVMVPGDLLGDEVDSAATLRAAIRQLQSMRPRPDVVLATGDLVNDALPAQYDHLMEILSELEIPLLPIPGNHDDRQLLRRHFDEVLPPGGPDDTIDYVVDLGPIRLVGLDTTEPGKHGGRLTAAQLRWLDERLGEAPDRPTIVFQHHPPFASGIDWMDLVGLADAELEAEVLRRHPQVQVVVSGHIHRTITARVGGTVGFVCPSSCAQVDLALDGTPFVYLDDVAGMALHRWEPEQGLTTHTVQVHDARRWVPGWAAHALAQQPPDGPLLSPDDLD